MAKVMATNLGFNVLEIIILRQVLIEYNDQGGYLAIMVALEALQDLSSPPPAFVAFAQAWQAWQALRCPCGGALPTTFVRPTLLPTILPMVAYNPFADMLGGQDRTRLRVTQTRHVSHSVSNQNKQAAEEKTCWSLSLAGQRDETPP